MILIIVMVIFSVNLMEFSKIQVMAARDVDNDLSKIQGRLLPRLNTCFRSCKSNSDCSDCWVCCSCDYMTFYTFQCGIGGDHMYNSKIPLKQSATKQCYTFMISCNFYVFFLVSFLVFTMYCENNKECQVMASDSRIKIYSNHMLSLLDFMCSYHAFTTFIYRCIVYIDYLIYLFILCINKMK